MKNQKGNAGLNLVFIAGGMALCAIVLFSVMWGWAHFRLWKAEYSGRALALEIEKEYVGKSVLAEATHARMARIEAAKAEKESAQLTADAIKIVGKAAKEFPEYRNQEFILSFGDALKDGTISQIIYVPTEANIPILEASRNM